MNYVFNNRLFCNTTVSYSNYLFDINSYTNNQYLGSSGTSFTNRYSADYRSGINDWNYQIDFDYNPSPNTTQIWNRIYLSSFPPGSYDL